MTTIDANARGEERASFGRREVGNSPTFFAAAFCILVASDMRFRVRDPRTTLAGSADVYVLVELVLWATVLVTAAVYVVRAGGLRSADISSDVGPALSVLSIITVGAWVSSLYSPAGALGIVTGGQTAILAWLSVVTYRTIRDSPERVVAFWLGIRRWLCVVTFGAALGSILHPSFGNMPVLSSPERYHFFEQHPIASGMLIGLTLLLVVAHGFTLRDPLLSGWSGPWLWAALCILLGYMLLATKARGALAGTAVGLVVLVALSPSSRRRGLTLLSIGVCTVVLALTPLLATAETVLFRGKSAEAALEEARTLTGRTDILALAIDDFYASPMIGHGFKAGKSLFLDELEWAGESHNVFIDIVVSFGLLGVIAYGTALWRISHQLGRAVTRKASELSLCGREGVALFMFILCTGMSSDGFSAGPGVEATILFLVAVVADAALEPTGSLETS